jgi:hypothetical protein
MTVRITAGLATLLLILVAGCSARVYYPTVEEAARAHMVAESVLAQVDDNHVVGTRRGDDDRIELLGFQRDADGWRLAQVEERELRGETYAVQVAAAPATGGWSGSYLFGTAGPGAVRVTFDREDERGGTVVDGVWALVIDVPEVDERTLAWRFLGLDGAPLRIGTGLLPPN